MNPEHVFSLLFVYVQLTHGDSASAFFDKTVEIRHKGVYARFTDIRRESFCIQSCLNHRRLDSNSCFSVNYFPANKTCELCHVVCNDTRDIEKAVGWRNWAVRQKFYSCAEWRQAGCTIDGDYFIDSSAGSSRFKVECAMNDAVEDTRTIMHHNHERKADAGKCEAPFSCVKQVTYAVPYSEISAVVDASKACKQFILFECKNSFIVFSTQQHQAWYSRDGSLMDYWGGATPGSQKCACGMTDSCACAGEVCNCDCNDDTMRSDSGYITDKTALPVTKMGFGDLGWPDEAGNFQLGPLECSGIP